MTQEERYQIIRDICDLRPSLRRGDNAEYLYHFEEDELYAELYDAQESALEAKTNSQ